VRPLTVDANYGTGWARRFLATLPGPSMSHGFCVCCALEWGLEKQYGYVSGWRASRSGKNINNVLHILLGLPFSSNVPDLVVSTLLSHTESEISCS
jgi:hypothetical protein